MNVLKKNYSRITYGILGVGAIWSFGKLTLETLILDNYKTLVWNRYQFGYPIKLNKKLEKLSEEVLKDLNLTDQKEKFEFFPAFGPIPFNFGYYQINKTLIGLPWYLEYNTKKDIDKNDLVFFGEQAPNWKSKDGRIFLDNLTLSDKAKKYIMTEYVVKSISYENFLRTFSPILASIVTILSLFKTLFLREKLKDKKFSNSILIKLSTVLLFVIYYVIIEIFIDSYSNEKLNIFFEKFKNQDLIEGGLEYYGKNKNRNLAILNFMNEDGKKYLKSDGNYQTFISKKYNVNEMIELLSKYDEFYKNPK